MGFGGLSWKRAVGSSATKARLSHRIGIPFTKSGQQRKLGRVVGRLLFGCSSDVCRRLTTDSPLCQETPLDHNSAVGFLKRRQAIVTRANLSLLVRPFTCGGMAARILASWSVGCPALRELEDSSYRINYGCPARSSFASYLRPRVVISLPESS